MFDNLRIAFVVEGPTDFAVLKEIMIKVLDSSDFVAQTLQPVMSEALRVPPGERGGWGEIYRWCREAVDREDGHLRDNPLFEIHDLLIIQVDADVAEKRYSDDNIKNPVSGAKLPCVQPCPPSSATTDRLRQVVLCWIGEKSSPPRVVICTPSKALETWALVGMFPDDAVVKRGNIECRANPESILRGKPKERKLVSGVNKNVGKYREFAPEIVRRWNTIKKHCSEAKRFEKDVQSAWQKLKSTTS